MKNEVNQLCCADLKIEDRFVMLDRDGTIIKQRHYLSDPDQVVLIHKAAEGLRRLSKMGLGLIIITNQSGIGRGLFSRDQFNLVHLRMCELLKNEGVEVKNIYYCPHTPEDGCACRKPSTGLVEQAVQDLGFDPRYSFMIGDNACDIELGLRVRATTLLVRTGYGTQIATEGLVKSDYIVDSVWEAVPVIERLVSVDS